MLPFVKIKISFTWKLIGNQRTVNMYFNHRRCRIILVVVTIAAVILLIYKKVSSDRFENLLKARVQPGQDKNVFFIETGSETENVTLNPRQACAIESAAMINPHLEVFVLYASRERLNSLEISSTVEAILSYPNVHVNYIDKEELAAGSPLEDLVCSKKLLRSNYRTEHTSDVLRLLVLWKYGGTYLDTDMIVRRNLDSIPSNFACVQDDDYVNGAILNFDTLRGKRLSEIFIQALVENFDGENFASNGPVLITNCLQGLCQTDNVTVMETMPQCKGFHVMKRNYCYSIPYYWWRMLFSEETVEYTMEQVVDSIVVHFWNNLSVGTKLDIKSKAPYVQLARKYCPKVFKTLVDFF